jgi:hypothetical protein
MHANQYRFTITSECPKSIVVDRFDADPDLTFHFDSDPDPASSSVVVDP